jgi:hypothetical protein
MADVELSGSYLFAVALSAPMAVQARDDCLRLRSRRAKHDILDELQRRWNVRDQGDYSRAMDWLQNGGDSTAFTREMQILAQHRAATVEAVVEALPGIPPTKATFLLQCRGIIRNGLLAWDLSRQANLIRWGVTVGWLTEAEAWNQLSGIAARAQAAFTSWRDFSRQFAIGWRYVDGGRPLPAIAATSIQKLFDDDSSPWWRIGWNGRLDFSHNAKPVAPPREPRCVRCDEFISAPVRFCPRCGLRQQSAAAGVRMNRLKAMMLSGAIASGGFLFFGFAFFHVGTQSSVAPEPVIFDPSPAPLTAPAPQPNSPALPQTQAPSVYYPASTPPPPAYFYPQPAPTVIVPAPRVYSWPQPPRQYVPPPVYGSPQDRRDDRDEHGNRGNGW